MIWGVTALIVILLLIAFWPEDNYVPVDWEQKGWF